jgi:hypothetical protein
VQSSDGYATACSDRCWLHTRQMSVCNTSVTDRSTAMMFYLLPELREDSRTWTAVLPVTLSFQLYWSIRLATVTKFCKEQEGFYPIIAATSLFMFTHLCGSLLLISEIEPIKIIKTSHLNTRVEPILEMWRISDICPILNKAYRNLSGINQTLLYLENR